MKCISDKGLATDAKTVLFGAKEGVITSNIHEESVCKQEQPKVIKEVYFEIAD